MKILGLQKLTLLDYPGHVACTVFLGGCNFRCPFCHNGHLLSEEVEPMMSEEALLSFLEKRKGILDAVCITGGEPTIHPQLPDFLRKIRGMGYRIKLDTNGYRPEVLRFVVEENLVDYVAMDIKNGPEHYGQTIGLTQPDLEKIRQSVDILLEERVDYELRTTVVHPIHTRESVLEMCRWLDSICQGRRVRRWFVQPFVDRDTVPVGGLSTPDEESLEVFADILRACAQYVELRGI